MGQAGWARPLKKVWVMDQSINLIYNLLFCDDLKLYRDNFKGDLIAPWDVLFSELKDRNELLRIVKEPQYESRQKILAYNELLRMGIKPERNELLGVIVEVGLDHGVDVLAAYRDNTARYINYSGKMVIWENRIDQGINNKIAELIQKGEQVIIRIGPWDKKRLPPPKKGDARLSFLVSDGLYFGQGPFGILSKDPLGGAVLKASSELMKMLIEKDLNK